ncbi:phosphoribosylanthranilate isomerase [Endozoicomonas sp. OPT23]|uniref:phosphoribosylanthranilate isomerase n=1 Tax=Endozoicomonas sp. OPT23 TaxID=2072845 RepID=UPI00129AC927|nr:phosphoribosylanthranilate isomerase [Endozoicomonas sp. OPT23]MRI35011.1 phosphoribosylanthranilate isomerase [Endozoicomonas sp. OPT23]
MKTRTETRIKVCGVTSVEEARAAVAAGADALGLVFYPASRRFLTVEKAREIALSVPPFITLVGLFVDAGEQEIQEILDHVPLGLLQFHGNETDQECGRWRRRYMKALRIRPDTPVRKLVDAYPGACGLLLDTYRKGVPGGTGEAFDWQLTPKELIASLDKPIVLAGGLTPDNVSEAIEQVAPYAVDVSSGVENSQGGKDPEKMRAFIQAVKS